MPRSSLSRGRPRAARAATVGLATAAAALAGAPAASAINYVSSANGESWAVNDAAMPGVDTGSIRSTNQNSLLGYGGLRMNVSGTRRDRLDGELLRGFGLTFDGIDEFRTTTPLHVAGVDVSRNLRINGAENWARWVDSFTNRTNAPVTIEVSFGGILGQASDTSSAFQASSAKVLTTSSGDAAITAADSWVAVGTPTAAAATPTSGPTQNGTSATVIGTPSGLLRMGNQLRNPFANALPAAGHESNFHGYLRRITLAPGQTRSLAHFAVIGLRDSAATAGAQIQAVTSRAAALAAAPDLSGISTAMRCTLVNWDLAAIDAALPATCATVQPPQPEKAPVPKVPTTSSPYDVVGKTITEMQADMRAGRTTSQEITRAYLDPDRRLRHRADGAAQLHPRRQGRDGPGEGRRRRPRPREGHGPARHPGRREGPLRHEGHADDERLARLRGLPPDEGRLPGRADARGGRGHPRQGEHVRVRELGPALREPVGPGLERDPAVEDLAGLLGRLRRGGGGELRRVRDGQPDRRLAERPVRRELARGAARHGRHELRLGRHAAELPAGLRRPDGALGQRPRDGPERHDRHRPRRRGLRRRRRRPADWRTFLDADSLRGKRIGYVPATFSSTSYGTTGTLDVANAALQELVAMGATLVPVSDAPGAPPNVSTPGTSTGTEGWARWIEAHPESPYKTAAEIQDSPKKLPYNRSSSPTTATGRMTPEQLAAHRERRLEYKRRIAQWMDDADVAAVIYPNNTSDFHDNDSLQLGGAFATAPASNSGAPEVIVPVGENDHGHPVSLQIQGRAWDDAKLLGFAYAIEQRLRGHVEPTQLPPLKYEPGVTPQPIVIEPAPAPETPAPAPLPSTNVDPGALNPPVPATPAAPAKPAATVKREVRLTTRTIRATRTGRIAFPIRCAPGAPSSCRVRVTATYGRTVVLRRTLTVKAGRTRALRVTAKGSLARRLARGATVRLQVSLRGTGGTTSRQPGSVAVRGTRR